MGIKITKDDGSRATLLRLRISPLAVAAVSLKGAFGLILSPKNIEVTVLSIDELFIMMTAIFLIRSNTQPGIIKI